MRCFIAFAFIGLLSFASCGKNKFYNTAIETYKLNPLYSGNHRSDFELNYYLKEDADGVQIQVLLSNIETIYANDYQISLHQSSATSPLGFDKQVTYDIGKSAATSNGAAAVLVTKLDWNTIKNFDGYLVVQDPLNLGIDSIEQLLVAQKLN